MEEQLTGVNEAVVAEQPAETVTDSGGVDVEETTPEAGVETPAVAEQTLPPEAFAKRLSQEREKIRAEIEQQYAKDRQFALQVAQENGFATVEELYEAIERQKLEQEAEQKGVDPELYEQIQTVFNAYQQSEREKSLLQQKEALKEKPFFNDFFQDIDAFANKYGVDYQTAYAAILSEKIDEVVKNIQIQGEQKAIKNIIGRDSASVGPANGTPSTLKTSIEDMAREDFLNLVEKAKRGELKNL